MDEQRSLKGLEELRRMAFSLPEPPTFAEIVQRSTRHGQYRQLQSENGPFHEVLLHDENAFAVSICWADTGVECARHIHTRSIEHYVVGRGRIRVILDYDDGQSRAIVISAGESVIIPLGVAHTCIVEDSASMVVVTVPAEEGMR